MSELFMKVFITMTIPILFSLTGFFQSRGFDTELMYWGALGQAMALVIQFADQRKKAQEKREKLDWILYLANLAKASLLALFFSQTIADKGWVETPHLAAIWIGLLADLSLPLLNHFKKYINEKITK